MKNTTTGDAVEHLAKKLRTNKGYRATWKANISMSFYDALKEKKGCSRMEIAANGAERFLKLLCEKRKTPK